MWKKIGAVLACIGIGSVGMGLTMLGVIGANAGLEDIANERKQKKKS